jgi:hypothetical protein
MGLRPTQRLSFSNCSPWMRHPPPLSSRGVDSRRRVKREITTLTKALGAPFKPYFGLSGQRCLPAPLSLGEAVTLLIFRARSSSLKGICPAASFCPSDPTAPNKKSSPSPLSSRAKPRDLQFSGPLVEMFFAERSGPSADAQRLSTCSM